MPYIDKESRSYWDDKSKDLIDSIHNNVDPGKMNYIITKLILKYINSKGIRYTNYNEAMGILECVKQELYRKAVAKYEDSKCVDNGEVY